MDIKDIFKSNGIDLIEGSHLDNVASSINEFAASLVGDWNIDFSAYDVDSLSGGELDRIGEFFGLTRRPAVEAVDFTGLNLKLTNKGDSEIEIPNGFEVYSENMTYKTTNATTITLGAGKWTTVPFQATEPGVIGNVGIGEINRSENSDIEAYNLAPVVSGADIEDDASFRYRLSRIRTLRIGGTADAIDAVIRTLPFVSDVRVETGNIPGTIDVYIEPVYGLLFGGLRDVINDVLKGVLAAGDVLVVHTPIYKVVKMKINLEVTEGQDFESVSNDVLNTAISLILGMKPNDTFEITTFTADIDYRLNGYPKLYRFIQVSEMIVYDTINGKSLLNPIPVQKQYTLGDNTLFTTNASYIQIV